MSPSLRDIKILIDLFEKTKKWPLFSNVYSKFKKNIPKILIIGPGGVGKSTLGEILNGKYRSLLDKHDEYEESLDIEILQVCNKTNAELEITPGQRHRLKAMWQEIGRNIEDGKYAGIIFVCSYGYHSIGNFDFKKSLDYTEGDSKKQFLAKYTNNRRAREIELLSLIASSITASVKPIWLLNFICKQDLWDNESAKVEAYYTSGEYHNIIETIKSKKHESHFRVETVFGCLTIDDFITGRGDVLCKNCPGYGIKQLSTSLLRLINSVDALLKWKKS